MRNLYYALIILYLIIGNCNTISLYSQNLNGTWERKKNMPTARWYPGTCVFDNKIYVIGGSKNADTPPLAVNEVYDPETDKWEIKTPMPSARAQVSACAINGKIYVIGGSLGPSNWTPVTTVDIYDPATDTWSKGTNMPTAREELGLTVINDKIFAIGGIISNSKPTDKVEVYDPTTDSWSNAANMPTLRGTMPAVTYEGKIYVFGGTQGGDAWKPMSNMEMYNPDDSTWITLTSMTSKRSHLNGCVFNNRIYAIGGSRVDENFTTKIVESYSPSTNSWKNEPPLLTAKEAYGIAVLNGKIFTIGGTSMSAGLEATSIVEVFDNKPKLSIRPNKIDLPIKGNDFVGKIYSPNNEKIKFDFYLTDSLDGSLFIISNDSLFIKKEAIPEPNSELTISIMAISEYNDTLVSVLKLITINTLGIEPIQDANRSNSLPTFSIYPNPTSGILNIKSNQINVYIKNIVMYGSTGNVIYKQTIPGNGHYSLNMDKLSKQVYILKIESTKCIEYYKILKE